MIALFWPEISIQGPEGPSGEVNWLEPAPEQALLPVRNRIPSAATKAVPKAAIGRNLVKNCILMDLSALLVKN